MKILVINGSPKGERSDTLKVTRAFIEGMGESFELIDTMQVSVKPCLGCYACWRVTPGKCVQKDDMEWILERILASDLVIWSTPLYCYSVPSNCKALYDRLIPLGTMEQKVDENGGTYHPGRQEIHTQIMLISGCGFPNRENNYEAMDFQFDRMFSKECPRIYCLESPLLGIAEAKPVADRYLAQVRKAGAEFKATGRISGETQTLLDAPMITPDVYRAQINGR
ncbi:MAG: flavodoxin family protein [Eubacteriales bacterium]|nr:flavodoxin family protein [Eubacteriales bacterium]